MTSIPLSDLGNKKSKTRRYYIHFFFFAIIREEMRSGGRKRREERKTMEKEGEREESKRGKKEDSAGALKNNSKSVIVVKAVRSLAQFKVHLRVAAQLDVNTHTHDFIILKFTVSCTSGGRPRRTFIKQYKNKVHLSVSHSADEPAKKPMSS